MSPPDENIRQVLSPFSSTSPTKNSTAAREWTLPPNPFALDSTPPPYLPPTNYTASTRPTQQSPTMNVVTFIRDHTTHNNDLPHLDECPICLDDYTNEQCLRITNIPECSHHIGANCLDNMFHSHSHEEKRCPLCRTVWIPARPLPVPRRSQNLSVSRRMAGMFAGLDEIGADIANQPLGIRRGFANDDTPQQQARRVRRELPNPDDSYVPGASMAEQQRAPIVIDSDSDDADYNTHVQDFEDFRREIADIRSRVPYRHVSRSSRRRRVAERSGNNRNGNGGANEGANEGANSSSNSNNAIATLGLRRMDTSARAGSGTPVTGAFNRFMNNRRTLNPFRPTTENNTATPPAPTGDALDQHKRAIEGFANLRRQAGERRASHQQHIPESESPPLHPPNVGASRVTTSHAHVPDANTPEAPMDIDMTSDELIELPNIRSLPAGEAVRSRQLDHREGNLNRREEAMTMRQTTLARREVELIAQETRIDRLMRVARRHREEAEELVRKHQKEIDEFLN